MCGIFCSLACSHESEGAKVVLDACKFNLQSRGPDQILSQPCHLASGYRLDLFASVLQTQGTNICSQPYSYDGDILCWNGDVFDGPLVKEIHESGQCDTAVVAKHLFDCVSNGSTPMDVMNQISGPYSFIFYSKQTETLWFGRDPIGRHSLLCGIWEHPFNLVVSSVAHTSLSQMKEVPAIGLFEVDLNTLGDNNALSVYLHPWQDIKEEMLHEFCEDFHIPFKMKDPCDCQYIFQPNPFTESQPSDLLSFSSLTYPHGMTLEEKIKFVANVPLFQNNITKVLSLLEQAVKVRVETNISLCQNCVTEQESDKTSCCHSKTAVLFSGGLDSAILALLADRFVPENEPIDLLNVAFEKKNLSASDAGKKNKTQNNPRNIFESSFDENSVYNVPDRLTGKKTLEELSILRPNRIWNFVEINVSLTELQQERSKYIVHLIYPLKTILDESLGCALWFAARGKGILHGSKEKYTSSARIIISGMGADEQFGGYMRHRLTLKKQGWDALCSQLQLELQRIPARNLGRDDRVISHHGRQPRMPFLDENVVNFVKSIPPWERCCPNDDFPCGIGDKMLLRLVAWKIGLKGAAILPKRAMQFGSRIANSKENAADTSNRL